jgi:uncharacterized protein
MTPLEFMLAELAVSIAAGVLGAMLGLGGGIIVVPALTLLLHIDIHYAIGASIVAVIATSSGAGAIYVKERLTNIRIAMLLETVTTTGAIGGAALAGLLAGRWLYLTFGLVLAWAAFEMWRTPLHHAGPAHPDRLADRFGLAGSYYDEARGEVISYKASRTPWGMALAAFGGATSGLLGIGGGTVKVPAMNLVMGIPFKAATATSNFMIGVTAAASASVYFYRGQINPYIAAPVAVGVLLGALLGSLLLNRVRGRVLRGVFTAVLVFIALQMAWRSVE